MNKFNIGDIVYIIKYHKINNKTIYFINKVRICNYNNRFNLYYISNKLNDDSLLYTTIRLNTYKEHRLFKTIEETEYELSIKNKELELRTQYQKELKNLRNINGVKNE